MTQEKTKGSDDRLLYLLTAGFAYALIAKKLNDAKPSLTQWLSSHLWFISALAGLIGLALAAVGYAAWQVLHDKRKDYLYLRSITAEKPGSVYAGMDSTGEAIFIPLEARNMHTEIIGTTNAGKTESVVIPWAVSDIRDMRGFAIIDGKADQSFISKVYAYAKKFHRGEDFKVFSLQDPNRSHTFNPLLGGTTEEVAERVFNSFEFDNSYYRAVQFEVFINVLRIFEKVNITPTFLRIYEAIKQPTVLHEFAVQGKDDSLILWATTFKSKAPSDRDEQTSGLLASISHFALGGHAKLFNTDDPDIDLDRALRESELVYFQLPVMKAPFLGKATGKMVLQCLQSAVANRHAKDEDDEKDNRPFFSIILDDFTEYLYPGFVTLLNKSRSAKVGVVFAHQALGDIKALGDDVATSILTNSNLKIIMRGNDPDSAEYFSKVIGTKSTVQTTERAEKGVLGGQKMTGQGSVREVEEFVVHPNIIKRNLGVGEAFVIIPHKRGTKTVKLKFEMLPKLPGDKQMPAPAEKPVLGLGIISAPQPSENITEKKKDNNQVAFAEPRNSISKEVH